MGFLNGLSALGSGVSAFAGQAGLEQQKSDLARQSLMLADQLATSREQNVTQPFQAAQQAAAIASQEKVAGGQQQTARDVAGIGANATLGAANIQGQTARAVATIGANAPPDIVKTLRALGVQLPGDNSPLPSSPAQSGGASASPSGAPQGGSGAPASSATAVPSGSATPDPLDNPIVAKALGMPLPGSEDALRRGIAQDVNSDPNFKYKTAGQRAAETEVRVAVAQGKMTDPASRNLMAAAIASYQVAPLSGFSLTKPGGPETMAEVMRINPDYQESRYPEVNKAMSAFGSGKQGDIIRANNVGIQHLDVIDQAAKDLGNNNVQALNSLKNTFQQQFGAPAPTTFDGLKQIVGTEIEKAVAGGIGSAGDRDRLMAALNRANSPAQLQAMTDGFRSLMVGQLAGLKQQYEEATGFKSGPFVFENKLSPVTVGRLSQPHGSASTQESAPLQPDRTAPMTPQQMYGGAGVAPGGANNDLQRLWGQ